METMTAEELFDSMYDSHLPPYKDHAWQGDTLLFATNEDYILVVPILPADNRVTVADKLWEAYHDRIEQDKYEAIEAEEIAAYEENSLNSAEIGLFFHLYY